MYKIFEVFYIFSSCLGYLAGLSFGYFLNKNWTFINQITANHSYAQAYFIAYTLSLITSQYFLYILVRAYNIKPMIANFGAMFMAMILNFISTNFIIFKKRNDIISN